MNNLINSYVTKLGSKRPIFYRNWVNIVMVILFMGGLLSGISISTSDSSTSMSDLSHAHLQLWSRLFYVASLIGIVYINILLTCLFRMGALKDQVQHLWEIMLHGKNLWSVEY